MLEYVYCSAMVIYAQENWENFQREIIHDWIGNRTLDLRHGNSNEAPKITSPNFRHADTSLRKPNHVPTPGFQGNKSLWIIIFNMSTFWPLCNPREAQQSLRTNTTTHPQGIKSSDDNNKAELRRAEVGGNLNVKTHKSRDFFGSFISSSNSTLIRHIFPRFIPCDDTDAAAAAAAI